MSMVINQRYRIRALLGAGGMGQVFLVEDLWRDGVILALKAGLPGEDAAAVRGLLVPEFLCLADLDDPRLVRVYDFDVVRSLQQDEEAHSGLGEEPFNLPLGDPFFTRDYIEGRSLLALARSLSLPARLDLLLELCDTLAYLHGQGWLHQDIKPENVLVEAASTRHPLRIRLMDFGLALDQNAEVQVRSGTALYMAPEVLKGEPYSVQAELYSLGVVFYEVLSGRHPFRGKGSTVQLIRAQMHDEAPPLLDVPLAVDGLVQALLSKDPARRPASAREVTEALLAGHPRRKGLRPPTQTWSSARFTGRTQELTELIGAAERLVATGDAPSSGVVVVTGWAGSGKSRLLSIARSHIQCLGAHVLVTGAVVDDGASRPGLPDAWRRVVEMVLRLRAPAHPSEARKFLTSWLKGDGLPALADDTTATRLRDVVIAVLTQEAAIHPLVLIFEDLHQSDPDALGWFLHLARQLPPRGLLLVGAGWLPGPTAAAMVRVQEALHGKAGVTWLTLDGLSEAEVSMLVSRFVGRPPSAELTRRLREHSDGNPLVLEEMLRGVADFDEVELRLTSGYLPGAVGEVSLKQMGRLGQGPSEALQALGVLGVPSRLEEIAQLLELPRAEVEAHVGLAMRARLLREADGRLWFSQAIMGRVCEESAPVQRRQWLHHQAARQVRARSSLDDPHALARLVLHHDRAGEATAALACALEGAELADRRFMTGLARDLFSRARELLAGGARPEGADPDVIRWRIQARLARLLLRGGAYAQAEVEVLDLLRTPPPPGLRADEEPWALWCLLGEVSSRMGLFDQALERLAQALGVAQSHRAASVLDQIADVHLRRGQRDKARQACEAALVRLDRADVALHASIEAHLGRCCQEAGAYDEALTHLNDARQLYASIQHLAGLAQTAGAIAFVYEFQQMHLSAVEAHRESLLLKERLGDVEGIATTLQRLSMVYMSAGNLTAAVSHAERSLEIYRQLRDVPGEARALSALSIFHQVQGSYKAALEYRFQALELQNRVGEIASSIQSYVNLGILYYEIGEFEEARRVMELAVTSAEELGNRFRVARCLSVLGLIESARGEREKGGRYLAEALKAMEEIGNADATALVLAMLGEDHLRWGEVELARKCLSRANNLASTLSRSTLLQVQVYRARIELLCPDADLEEIDLELQEAEHAATQTQYADLLWQIQELRGRYLLRVGRPSEAARAFGVAMDITYRCYQQLPEHLRGIYTADSRRLGLRAAMEAALKQVGWGRRRSGPVALEGDARGRN